MNDIRPCDVENVNAEYLDCCLSDYFNGSNANEVLAVPMYANITYKEALEAAKNEFHTSSGYFDEVAGSGGMVEDALSLLFSCIEDINAPADFAKYIEEDDDECGDAVYLYIALVAE